MVDRLRSVLSALGAALTGAGVLILLFVAYQLWGTGLYTARQQDSLRSEFKQKAHIEQPASSTTSTTVDPQHLPPAPPTGDAVANIRIPKIGVDKYVVQGVGEADLRKGPGHYPATALPGLGQTVAIAGHRTTYLAPFRHIDALSPGDQIVLNMPYGQFTYVVQFHKIVLPTALWITKNVGYERLVLSACNPLYSAAQRIVIFARLQGVQPARSVRSVA